MCDIIHKLMISSHDEISVSIEIAHKLVAMMDSRKIVILPCLFIGVLFALVSVCEFIFNSLNKLLDVSCYFFDLFGF